MSRESISYFYVSIAVLLWASTPVVGKLLLRNLSSLQLLFYATLAATLFLAVLVLLRGNLKIVKSYSLEDYRRFAYMGFLGVFLYYSLFYIALQHAPVQEVFIINYTWPLWVVVFASFFLKEPLGTRKLLALMLSFAGVYIVITRGQAPGLSLTNIKGDMLALAAAAAYGLFSVLAKKHSEDRLAATLFYYTFAFIYVAIFSLLFSSVVAVSVREALGLVWLGVFTTGIAFLCWLSALKHGRTATVSNLVFLTPFVSLLYTYVVIGEVIRLSSLLGCVLIVLGIIVQSYSRPRLRQKPAGIPI